MIHETFQTEEIKKRQFELFTQHAEEMQAVVVALSQLLTHKGTDYNQLTTFIENMPFGDYSWATLCWIKAHRAASLVSKLSQGNDPEFDPIDDVIRDLAAYAIAWLAFRSVMKKEGHND